MLVAKAERREAKRLRREAMAASRAGAGSGRPRGHRLDPAHRETTTTVA